MKTMISRMMLCRLFQHVERYLERMEFVVNDEQHHLSEEASRAAEGMAPEERNEYAVDYAEEHDFLVNILPGMLWYGAFITIWAIFEREMVWLCQVDLDWRIRVNSERLEGQELKGHRKARQYWTRRGVVVPEPDETWQEIESYYEVRNQIAHDNGKRAGEFAAQQAAERSRKVDAYVAKRVSEGKDGISFDKFGSLVLTAGYCREALANMNGFLAKLIVLIPDES